MLAALPSLPAAWRGSRRRRDHLLVCAAAAAAADTAAEDGEEDEAAYTGADADHDGFMVVDPRGDLAADGGASAAAVLTFAAAAAVGAIEEVLLQAEALVGGEFGRAAGHYAGGRVASVGVVAGGVGAHDGLALLVARRALAGGAFEAIATAVTIRGVGVGWADSSITWASLLRITVARALTADSACACKLAVAAAVFVGVVADRVVLVSASRGVTAGIVATTLLATAVTLFVALYDAVTTLLASDGFHFSVIAQAIGIDIVVLDSTADVADRARREFINTSLTRRIHDVPLIGIARGCVQMTALR